MLSYESPCVPTEVTRPGCCKTLRVANRGILGGFNWFTYRNPQVDGGDHCSTMLLKGSVT